MSFWKHSSMAAAFPKKMERYGFSALKTAYGTTAEHH